MKIQKKKLRNKSVYFFPSHEFLKMVIAENVWFYVIHRIEKYVLIIIRENVN